MNRWVKTANGQAFADSIGVNEPPMTVEESAKGVLEQVVPILNFYLKSTKSCLTRSRLTMPPKPPLRDLSCLMMARFFHGSSERISGRTGRRLVVCGLNDMLT